ELALALAHDRADGRVTGHDGHLSIDARLADRRGHVGAGDPHAAGVVERDGIRRRELTQGRAVAERQAALHREPGERPVHGARVEIAEAEPLGEPRRDCAFPRSRGAVDGDDHRFETESRRSKNPGKLIATASAPSTSTPCRETRPATAASTAIRWSPSDAIRPPVGRAGTPFTSKPSSRARMWMPSVRSRVV